MKTRQYFFESDLDACFDPQSGAISHAGYALRAPMPQVFLVTGGTTLSVRTTVMTPISWGPYTMAVSISQDDQPTATNLAAPQAGCVLALPSRNHLRQLVLCSQRYPIGVSEAAVARFQLCQSQVVQVPGLLDCPVNFECQVDHVQPYYGYLIAFLRVVAANIDTALLYKDRKEIVELFPTNLADEVAGPDGRVRQRVSLLSELFECPTFPAAPKQGWYSTFDRWLRELGEEKYISPADCEILLGWSQSWGQLFSQLDSPDRPPLREKLTHSVRLIAHEQWDELYQYLGN